jgi:hypothetical protein
MRRTTTLLIAALVLLGPSAVGAQAPPPPPVVADPGLPGNPTQPADRANNPHPTMPWLVTSPYGVVQRWVWMPPQPVLVNEQIVYEPGFWVAQTTAGYYYPTRWVLRESAPGRYSWVLLNGGAVPFAR